MHSSSWKTQYYGVNVTTKSNRVRAEHFQATLFVMSLQGRGKLHGQRREERACAGPERKNAG